MNKTRLMQKPAVFMFLLFFFLSSSTFANCIDRYYNSFKVKKNWSLAFLAGSTGLGIALPPTLIATLPYGLYTIPNHYKKGQARKDIYLALKDANVDSEGVYSSPQRWKKYHKHMNAARSYYQLSTWNEERFLREFMQANEIDLYCRPRNYDRNKVAFATRTDVVAILVYAEVRRLNLNTLDLGDLQKSSDYKDFKARVKKAIKES